MTWLKKKPARVLKLTETLLLAFLLELLINEKLYAYLVSEKDNLSISQFSALKLVFHKSSA